MFINNTQQLARRAFLKRAGHLGLAGIATPWALNLAAMGEAAAFSATDYKALVCVFLYGGNDYGNTIVPVDSANYAKYAAIRTGIATPLDTLAATTLSPTIALPGGMQLAMAPQLLEPYNPLFTPLMGTAPLLLTWYCTAVCPARNTELPVTEIQLNTELVLLDKARSPILPPHPETEPSEMKLARMTVGRYGKKAWAGAVQIWRCIAPASWA